VARGNDRQTTASPNADSPNILNRAISSITAELLAGAWVLSLADRSHHFKRKHGTHPYLGPMRITQAHDNGTVKLTKVANNGGAVSQTWNIWNIEPRMA